METETVGTPGSIIAETEFHLVESVVTLGHTHFPVCLNGSFVVLVHIEPERGCAARARGIADVMEKFGKNPASACCWEHVDALQPPNPGTAPVTPFACNQALPYRLVFILGKVIVAACGVGDNGFGADSGRGRVEAKAFTFICAGEIKPDNLVQIIAGCPADPDNRGINRGVGHRCLWCLGVQAGINDKLTYLETGR